MFDESQETFACSRDLLHRVLLARTVFIVQEKMLRFPRGFIGSLGHLVNCMFDESQETFACSRDLLHRVLLARTVFIVACSRDLLHRVLLARTVFIVQEKMLRFPRGFIGSLGRLVNCMFDESQETFACS